MFENEKKIFAKNLQEGYTKTKFQIYEKRIRQTRKGENYIELRLGDRTGTTTARLFFEQAQVKTKFESFSKGNIVRLEGQYSKKFKSISVNDPAKISKCSSSECCLEDFRCTSGKNIKELLGEIKTTIEAMKNDHLKRLLEEMFNDQNIH